MFVSLYFKPNEICAIYTYSLLIAPFNNFFPHIWIREREQWLYTPEASGWRKEDRISSPGGGGSPYNTLSVGDPTDRVNVDFRNMEKRPELENKQTNQLTN